MTTPGGISDEIRQAVRDEDCERLGHDLSLGSLFAAGATARVDRIAGPPGQLPHLWCPRCDRVWLLVEDPGRGYADALQRLRGRLKNPDALRPTPSDPSATRGA